MTLAAAPFTAWPERDRTLVVGHRGAMAYAPENTFASFELALEQGADLIELDVHLSRDGQVVVIHDERLERTTSGQGWVGEQTAAQLQQLDAGAWFAPAYAGQRIPLLSEVLDWARGRTRLAIEIKNAPIFYAGIEARIVALLARHAMRERALVISFDHQALRRVRELDAGVLTGALYSCRPAEPLGLAAAAGAQVLEPHWSFVRAEDVAAAHAAGLKVSTWATSEPDLLRRLIAAGVDGIATNHPDLLLGLLAETGPAGV
jgi:glycerophosphoryl diester phosphodiesterase